MTKHSLYLCGGINGLTDDECMNWRAFAKARSRAKGIMCVDPMRRDYRGNEDDHSVEIVENDKLDIDRCQAVLVNATRPSWGTAMEVIYAYEHGKMVVAFTGESPVSPWLTYHTNQTVRSLESATLFCLNHLETLESP
jgi:nucleoside 2-deoxyribosyltransferase